MADNSKTSHTVTLTDNATGKSIEMPVLEGSVGPSVIDIRKLYAETGFFTYDPGFTSTGSCQSELTYIDGDVGILRHRGYAIDDLAENADFLEVCHLLIYGELPNATEKKQFETDITLHTMVHEQMRNFYNGFRRDAHPMAIMVGVIGAMSAFYHDSTDINDQESKVSKLQKDDRTYRMMESLGTKPNVMYQAKITNTAEA